jgi:hypothetical protein
MPGKSSTHGEHEKCIQNFGGKTLTEETYEGMDRILAVLLGIRQWNLVFRKGCESRDQLKKSIIFRGRLYAVMSVNTFVNWVTSVSVPSLPDYLLAIGFLVISSMVQGEIIWDVNFLYNRRRLSLSREYLLKIWSCGNIDTYFKSWRI